MDYAVQYEQTYSGDDGNRKFKIKLIVACILFLLLIIFGYILINSTQNKNKGATTPESTGKYNLTVTVKSPQYVEKVQVIAGSKTSIMSTRKPNGEIPDGKVVSENPVEKEGSVVFRLNKGIYFVHVILNEKGQKQTAGYYSTDINLEKNTKIELVPFIIIK